MTFNIDAFCQPVGYWILEFLCAC